MTSAMVESKTRPEMSIFTKQRHTEIERRFGVPKGEEVGGEDRELEFADANWYIRGGKKHSPAVQHGDPHSVSCDEP